MVNKVLITTYTHLSDVSDGHLCRWLNHAIGLQFFDRVGVVEQVVVGGESLDMDDTNGDEIDGEIWESAELDKQLCLSLKTVQVPKFHEGYGLNVGAREFVDSKSQDILYFGNWQRKLSEDEIWSVALPNDGKGLVRLESCILAVDNISWQLLEGFDEVMESVRVKCQCEDCVGKRVATLDVTWGDASKYKKGRTS